MIPEGQLTNIEREYLYNLVKEIKPDFILESGTWHGGGSTLSLTKGLFENNKGILDTYEENNYFYTIANNYYSSSIYKNFINLFNINFIDGIDNLSEEEIQKYDIVFLDGGDESSDGRHKLSIESYLKDFNVSENVQSFRILENKLKKNTHVLLHDWSIIEGRGNFVKRYLESINFKNFELKNIIDESTGLAHLVKIN